MWGQSWESMIGGRAGRARHMPVPGTLVALLILGLGGACNGTSTPSQPGGNAGANGLDPDASAAGNGGRTSSADGSGGRPPGTSGGAGDTWSPDAGAGTGGAGGGPASEDGGAPPLSPIQLPASLAKIQQLDAGGTRVDYYGISVALSADGGTMAIGVPGDSSNDTGIGDVPKNATGASFSGAVYVLVRTDTGFVTEAYVKASNTGVNDAFGQSVALSADGNTLAVGAYTESSNGTGVDSDTQSNDAARESGAAYVFTRSGKSWSQQAYVKASNTDAHDDFGNAVALSADGNRLAVGAFAEASSGKGVNGTGQGDNAADHAGAVYLFDRTGSAWAQTAYVKASNTDAGDQFGFALSLSGDGRTLAVGAWQERSHGTGINGDAQSDNSAFRDGAVYVFAQSSGAWAQQAYVKASVPTDSFGQTLSLSADGDTLAVGSPISAGKNHTPEAGAVFVFARSAEQWSEQAYLNASDAHLSGYFGESVALSRDGNVLAVGASYQGSFQGNAYVLSRTGASWSEQLITDEYDDQFGFSVAVAAPGDKLLLAVGAPNVSGASTSYSPGKVYVFE